MAGCGKKQFGGTRFAHFGRLDAGWLKIDGGMRNEKQKISFTDVTRRTAIDSTDPEGIEKNRKHCGSGEMAGLRQRSGGMRD